MVLGTSRRIAIFKVATLQRQSHLQSCNVPFRQGAGRPFQRHALPGSSLQAAGAKSRRRGSIRYTASVQAPSESANSSF